MAPTYPGISIELTRGIKPPKCFLSTNYWVSAFAIVISHSYSYDFLAQQGIRLSVVAAPYINEAEKDRQSLLFVCQETRIKKRETLYCYDIFAKAS